MVAAASPSAASVVAVAVVFTGLSAAAVPAWLAAGLMLIATVAGVGWWQRPATRLRRELDPRAG